MNPLLPFTRWVRTRLLRLFGRNLTEEDLQTLMEEGEQEGVLDPGEHEMIDGVLELTDTRVREIMVPRTDMRALPLETPLDQVVAFVVAEEHSRVPVYRGDLDHVVGILFAKDLLRHWGKKAGEVALADLLRPAYIIPEAKAVSDLLAEFRARRVHMAIVVDEFGGTAGLVTIEDVLEEIVGEIRDEYDTDEPAPVVRLPDGSRLFDARARLPQVEEEMGVELPAGDYETLGGFVTLRLGRVPTAGEQVSEGGILFTVEEADARRVTRIRSETIPAED